MTQATMSSYNSRTESTDAKALPPFPSDIETHPLLVVDFAKLKADDAEEKAALWDAFTSLGFIYLKNHGVGPEAMWAMGKETLALPLGEKMKFEQGDSGMSFGYKKSGANAVDEHGIHLDTPEFVNISRDDAYSYPDTFPVHRRYPAPTEARLADVAAFMRSAEGVLRVILGVCEEKLGLLHGALGRRLHNIAEHSGSESRIIRNPPPKEQATVGPAIGAHTDFGTLSFLFNILGGLQVLPPGSETWKWIRPLPGHVVVNAGDALSIFSGGIITSSIHRVVPPPPPQAAHVRYSLVYFLRPGWSQLLNPLVEESQTVKDAVARQPAEQRQVLGVTAHEWFARRIKNQRIKNRTGPETWKASRGTEHTPQAA